MKSSLLVGTLAATLVSSLQAEVYVLGASWRERVLAAPEGRIERAKRDSAAPRGYVIMESSEGGLEAAFIEYRNVKSLGKSYSITTGFTGFNADVVTDTNGQSLRIFGHIFTTVTGTEVEDPRMPFSGSVVGLSGWPKRVTFDRTVFQAGDSTDLPGPALVAGTMSRSILSGGGARVQIASTTLEDAIEELASRLEAGGYERNAVAPVITEDLPATVARDGFRTANLSVGLGPDVFPTPTYRWFKLAATPGDPPVQVGSSATYTAPGGAEGDGSYYVEVSTSAGSVTSSTVVVSTTNKALTIGPNLPATLAVGFDETAVLSVTTNADAYPQVTTYQWEKSTTTPTGTFTAIPAGSGGTQPTFTVTGATAAPNGPGHYRVRIFTGPTTSTLSAVCTVTTAP